MQRSDVRGRESEGRGWARRLGVLVATGFGLGYSPVAPGTVGSIWGVIIAWALNSSATWPVQAAVAAVLAVIAIPACDVAEKSFGTKDDHRIVADEYLTFPICMIGLPPLPWVLAVAFLSNRFFDIVKFPPARGLQRLHGGFGVVIDDVFASLYSLAFNWAVYALVARM